jgi:ammonia channel protein AmtB
MKSRRLYSHPVDKTLGLRVKDEDEATGLDLSQHDEAAYHHESERLTVQSAVEVPVR